MEGNTRNEFVQYNNKEQKEKVRIHIFIKNNILISNILFVITIQF